MLSSDVDLRISLLHKYHAKREKKETNNNRIELIILIKPIDTCVFLKRLFGVFFNHLILHIRQTMRTIAITNLLIRK